MFRRTRAPCTCHLLPGRVPFLFLASEILRDCRMSWCASTTWSLASAFPTAPTPGRRSTTCPFTTTTRFKTLCVAACLWHLRAVSHVRVCCPQSECQLGSTGQCASSTVAAGPGPVRELKSVGARPCLVPANATDVLQVRTCITGMLAGSQP